MSCSKTTDSFFLHLLFLIWVWVKAKKCRLLCSCFLLSVGRLKWGIWEALLTSRWVMTGCISSLIIHLKIYYLAPPEHRTQNRVNRLCCFIEHPNNSLQFVWLQFLIISFYFKGFTLEREKKINWNKLFSSCHCQTFQDKCCWKLLSWLIYVFRV